jgi:hypothetical protein
MFRKDHHNPRYNKEVSVYIEKLHPEIRKMTNKIRSIIINSASEVEESIKHKIPFYSYKGLLCYINTTNEKVIVGFSQGAEFSNDDKLLIGTGKTVRHLIYKSVKEIKTAKLQQLIYEALIINEIRGATHVKRKKALFKAVTG